MTRACQASAVLLLIVPPCWLRADDEPSLRDRWSAVYREIAASIRMQPAADGEPFELREQPLLKYANPVRIWDQHGSVFLWTRSGRPAVIGSIWSVKHRNDPASRNVSYEWHSLAVVPVAAVREELLWKTSEAGVQWQECPAARPPAANRRLRLSQMRRLAKRVSANIETGESELRLMSQPLYRYPKSVPDVVDGAIFAYVMGTDPELVMLIEARGDGRQAAWHWAFARFTNAGLTVLDDSREVYSCKHHRLTDDPGGYFAKFHAETRPAQLDQGTP